MWLSLIVMLVTYLLSPKGTEEEKRKALANAALAGGATYLATEYTDWGKNLSNSFDSAIGVGGANTTTNADGTTSIKTPTTTTGGTSTWGSHGAWLTGGLAAGAGAAAVRTMPSWVPWAALGLGAYLLLKD